MRNAALAISWVIIVVGLITCTVVADAGSPGEALSMFAAWEARIWTGSLVVAIAGHWVALMAIAAGVDAAYRPKRS